MTITIGISKVSVSTIILIFIMLTIVYWETHNIIIHYNVS